MASATGGRVDEFDDTVTGMRRNEVRHVEPVRTETKVSTKTTELIVMVLAVIGVFLAGIMDDSVNTETTWMLITAIAIGYMLSRGLAKSGSSYRDDDRS
jgi:di/tricarboxylate transporter